MTTTLLVLCESEAAALQWRARAGRFADARVEACAAREAWHGALRTALAAGNGSVIVCREQTWLQDDVVRLPEQRVVRAYAVRTGRELVRDRLAVLQHSDLLAVHRDEDFAESHVVFRLPRHRDRRDVRRGTLRDDTIGALTATGSIDCALTRLDHGSPFSL